MLLISSVLLVREQKYNKKSGAEGIRTPVQTKNHKAFYMFSN